MGIRQLSFSILVFTVWLAVSPAVAQPADGTVLYATSFAGGVGGEWGSLAGGFSAYDSDADTIADALRQTGGEACTLVFFADQGCVSTAQGVRWNNQYLNDYEVVMHGRGETGDADIGIAVRGNRGSALTFQYINGNFQVLKANAGGGWSFGADFGTATNYIPGFDVTQVHEYKVRALDGSFEFRVDGVQIGTQTNPVVGGRTFDNASTGTVGIAGWDPLIVLDFSVTFIAGGQPLPPVQSPKGQIVLRQNASDCADYYLYVPSGAISAVPLPLVITSHSTVTTADEEIGLQPDPTWGCCEESPYPHTRWYELAENAGNVNRHNQWFIVAAPAMASANGGLVEPWSGESQAAADEQRLLAIYDQIVHAEAAAYGFAVDPGRVLLTGWSGGGIPTYYAGVRHPVVFPMIVSRQGNFDADMFDTAPQPLNTSLLVAILNGVNDTVVPRSKHEIARDWFVTNGYPRVFAAPADPHIRDLPDGEFPDVPSNHYCHSLAAFDTFMDFMPPVQPEIVAVVPSPEIVAPGSEYHKQLVLMQGTPPVTWSLGQDPPVAVISSDGYVSGWTPGIADINRIFSFESRAENSVGSDVVAWQVRVLSRSDFDRDGDVDQADFGHLQGCISGEGQICASGCTDADLSGDGDVDQPDFSLFYECLGGADYPPGC